MINKLFNYIKKKWWSIFFYTAVLISFLTNNNKHYHSLVMQLIGTACIIEGVSTFIITKQNVKNAIVLKGTVIKLLTESMSDGDETTRPLIEYINENSEKKTFKSKNGYLPSSYKVGETVEVLVGKDKNGEEKLYIKSKYDIWGASIFCIAFGLILWLLAIFTMLYDIPVSND